ncbi:hypothetical protein RCL1_008967 [Eukaryota sp. TZLM3-RCL]
MTRRSSIIIAGSYDVLSTLALLSNSSRRFWLDEYFSSLQPKIQSFLSPSFSHLSSNQLLDTLYESLSNEEKDLYCHVEACHTVVIPFSKWPHVHEVLATPDVIQAVEEYMINEGTSHLSKRDAFSRPIVSVFPRLKRTINSLIKRQPSLLQSNLCFLATINALSVKAVVKGYNHSVCIDVGGSSDKSNSYISIARQEALEELCLDLPPAVFNETTQWYRRRELGMTVSFYQHYKMGRGDFRSYFSLVDLPKSYEEKV